MFQKICFEVFVINQRRKTIDRLHKWSLNLNNYTWYILSLTFMFQDRNFHINVRLRMYQVLLFKFRRLLYKGSMFYQISKLRKEGGNNDAQQRIFGELHGFSSIKTRIKEQTQIYAKNVTSVLLTACYNQREGICPKRPVNTKETNKRGKIYVGRLLTLHISFCFMLIDYAWITCMNYMIAMFLLVSCMSAVNHLCILPGFVQGEPPSRPTKI